MTTELNYIGEVRAALREAYDMLLPAAEMPDGLYTDAAQAEITEARHDIHAAMSRLANISVKLHKEQGES